MKPPCHYIFVLWAEDFAADAATIFVTELRQAGLPVKVVGLTARRMNGAHGLALIPDLTLDEALPLAAKTTCLIIPHAATRLTRLENDPRLRDFCRQAQANHALFVLGPAQKSNPDHIPFVPLLPTLPLTYPTTEALVPFARRVVCLLKDVVLSQ
jgi:hypothetical protein